jgi:hypothetical protein
MNFFIHNCFIYFDLAGNENDVYDVEFEVNDENKFDNLQNGMLNRFILLLIFFSKILYKFFIHNCFLYFDIDGNKVVCNVELKVNNDNKYEYKLIDDIENVVILKAVMLFTFLTKLST